MTNTLFNRGCALKPERLVFQNLEFKPVSIADIQKAKEAQKPNYKYADLVNKKLVSEKDAPYGDAKEKHKDITSEDIRMIALARIEKGIQEEAAKELAGLSQVVKTANTGEAAKIPEAKPTPPAVASRLVDKKEYENTPKGLMEEAKDIARKTGTTIIPTKNQQDLIRTMYPMAIIDGDFKKEMTVDQCVAKFGKRVGGSNYSSELLLKAANDIPETHTPEFKALLNNLVITGKITKLQNGKFEAKEKGGVILTIPDGDPTFPLHEARHAEAGFYGLRENPELLTKVEQIIQKQSSEWKKTTLAFFMGTPYWEGIQHPTGFTPLPPGGKPDVNQKAQEYLEKSSGNILINPEKRAWMIDELLAYVTDKNEKTVPDIPELYGFLEKNSKKLNEK